MNREYTPIDCGLYSQYEVHILHHDRLRMAWYDEAGDKHLELLEPRDLRTEKGGEYLVCDKPHGESVAIRLDRIIQAEPVTKGQH